MLLLGSGLPSAPNRMRFALAQADNPLIGPIKENRNRISLRHHGADQRYGGGLLNCAYRIGL
jgi:hypothetical protein